MSIYSALQLNMLDECIGKSPSDIFIQYKFPLIQEKLINAAKIGEKEFSFYAPDGMDFSRYFPGCVIEIIRPPSSSWTEISSKICYNIIWKPPATVEAYTNKTIKPVTTSSHDDPFYRIFSNTTIPPVSHGPQEPIVATTPQLSTVTPLTNYTAHKSVGDC